MSKLIESNNGAVTFSIKNETDAKLVSLAIRIMADIEKKANEEKERLNRRPFWIWDKRENWWRCLIDVAGNTILMWGFTNAADPYSVDSLVGVDASCYRYYPVGDYSYKTSIGRYRVDLFAHEINYFYKKMTEQIGISQDRIGRIEENPIYLRHTKPE